MIRLKDGRVVYDGVALSPEELVKANRESEVS